MANEKRLIDCEQAKRATYEEIFWTESEQAVVRNFLAKLPRVDAVEVVHSRWDTVFYERNGTLASYSHLCPKCKYFYRDVRFKGHNYCPKCGADMRERKTDD